MAKAIVISSIAKRWPMQFRAPPENARRRNEAAVFAAVALGALDSLSSEVAFTK
jgi:hypothetical protein